VVREGNKRATSTHPTQSEAAESGRNLARRDKSEFFLHAQDGQIREHRDYRERQSSPDEGIVDTVSETVGTLTGVVGGTTGGRGTGRWRCEPGNGDHRGPGGRLRLYSAAFRRTEASCTMGVGVPVVPQIRTALWRV
jgi:hypothetical protein